MFGNGSSFNNIFGGITESHLRLFGGDRALATKDIEGAQPRKFNKHVWGGYEPNPFNHGLDIDPSKSSIRSPILGDSVQPVNRAVPNSSGLIFRDPASMSQTSNGRLMAASADRLRNQQQPTPSGISGGAQSALAERKQASTGNNFGQERRDSKYGVIPQLRLPSGGESGQMDKNRGNIPVSQVREQNIFSQPSYINQGTPGQNKSATPLSAEKQMQIAIVKEKMERHRQAHSTLSQKVLTSTRSPESYVPPVFSPSNDQLDQKNSSRRFQTEASDPQQANLYIDQQVKALQKNPIFSQNRNFGPDSVLYSTKSTANMLRPSQQNQSDVLSSFRNSRPSTNQQQPQQEQQQSAPAQQQQQEQLSQKPETASVPRRNSSQIPVQNQQKANIKQESEVPQQQRPPSNNVLRKSESAFRVPSVPFVTEKNFEEVLRQSRESLRNIMRSEQNKDPLLSSRYSSASQQLKEKDNLRQKVDPIPGGYIKPASRGMNMSQNGEFRQMSASEMLRQRTGIRSALSSRGRMILNQEKQRQTSNAEYGVYLDYAKAGGLADFFPKEKVLYQSRRDNFLRSQGPRSQSAEGNRLQNELSSKQQINTNSNNISNVGSPIGALINGAKKILAIKKFEQYGVNDYDIVNNISVNPRVESPLKRRTENQPEQDFGSKVLLSSRQGKDEVLDRQTGGNNNKDPLDAQLRKSKNTTNSDAFRRSGSIHSPIAGMKNEYAESDINKQLSSISQLMLEKQQSIDGNGIKFFGGKALKNLSNVNLY